MLLRRVRDEAAGPMIAVRIEREVLCQIGAEEGERYCIHISGVQVELNFRAGQEGLQHTNINAFARDVSDAVLRVVIPGRLALAKLRNEPAENLDCLDEIGLGAPTAIFI